MANSDEELAVQTTAEEENPAVEDDIDVLADIDSAPASDEGESGEVDLKASEEGDKSDEPEPDPDNWLLTDPKETAKKEKGWKTITQDDIAAAKHHQKLKLERRHQAEMDQLKAENEALKRADIRPQSPSPSVAPRPKIEDYDHDTGAYDRAVDEWNDRKIKTEVDLAVERSTQESQRTTSERDYGQRVERSVKAHYQRAEEMSLKHKISAEAFIDTDSAFRTSIDDIYPGRGDAIANEFIETLGDDSEKVVFFLKRNAAAAEKFQAALREDPTLLKALGVFCKQAGVASEQIARLKKQTSHAPIPTKQIKGNNDAGNSLTSSLSKSLYKQYATAKKVNNGQALFDISRKAKEKGIDTKDW